MTVLLIAAALLIAPAEGQAQSNAPQVDSCPNGKLPTGGTGADLEITTACTAGAGTYLYGNVNIYNGGSLNFVEAPGGAIDFWARGILIENNASLIAGSPSKPFGALGAVLTFHLWGPAQDPTPAPGGQGITCKTPVDHGAPCGIDPTAWNDGSNTKVTLPSNDPNNKPIDYFYKYIPLPFDGGGEPVGYFGYKVLALSYGGTLQLFGWKGAKYGTVQPNDSGESWARLNATIDPSNSATASQVTLDRKVATWQMGDTIVVTTTDYLPGHSEVKKITNVQTNSQGQTVLTVDSAFTWLHNGTKYSLSDVPTRIGLPADITAAETRAAVGLLTRSIRIVSGGSTLMTDLPDNSYFGGHTIARQGFKAFQVDGVEFALMGQGGRLGHYPVHFHITRQVPPNTYIRDSSINESMTRWIAIHATQGIEISRNVGWKSIGHGFYLEDGTETNNKFYSNLGVLARAAVENPPTPGVPTPNPNPLNPRQVPGILFAPNGTLENVPYYSDVDHPTIFWIMNGWNDFQYNVAAGAGACGVCYWLVPGWNSGQSASMKWEGYASMQNNIDRAGTTPLKSFIGNSCTSAMTSFQTVGNTTFCAGVKDPPPSNGLNWPYLPGVPNPLAPMIGSSEAATYYPNVAGAGSRKATYCGQTDCGSSATPPVHVCASGTLENCAVTVLDRYETAFNWADINFAAIWLRPQWYLVINSIVSDIQDTGLSFITGGGYTRSDIPPGHFAVARKDVFIGNTQNNNPYASNAGPFNPNGLVCDAGSNPVAPPGNYCLKADQTISMPIANFGQNQKMLNIYDGPMYEDSNAFLNITRTMLNCKPGQCNASAQPYYMNATMIGTTQDKNGACYLPNAAIGWKQPNGFYYPPAFHSVNLFFDNVDIRHFVIEPLFLTTPGNLYRTDPTAVQQRYCKSSPAMFDNYSDIDRQTELSDDDGSLTGLTSKGSTTGETVSVNEDPFFNAPVEAGECGSDEDASPTGPTAKTSPYDYVTTVEFPSCAADNPAGCGTDWSPVCENNLCFGVPLYRQLLTATEMAAGATPHILMAAQGTGQRANLTANNGVYYIDSTVGSANQRSARTGAPPISMTSVFDAGKTYYTFLLFAQPNIKQTYQIYVGSCPAGTPESECFHPETDLSAYTVNIPGLYQFSKVPWPSTWGDQKAAYDKTTGIVTVTMNMNFTEFKNAYEATAKTRCLPQSFCSWTGGDTVAQGGKCSCNPNPTNPDQLLNPSECSETNVGGSGMTVCDWAVKDIDCPTDPADPNKTVCYGFGVKLPSNFKTDPTPNPRPAPTCITTTTPPGFNTSFDFASADLAGSCHNPPVSPPNFCTQTAERGGPKLAAGFSQHSIDDFFRRISQ